MNNPARRQELKGRLNGSAYGTVALLVVLGAVVVVLGIRIGRQGRELADTKQQLTESQAATVQAQAELTKAKAATAQVQSQLEKANIQIADAQAQLGQEKDATKQMQSLVDEEKSQVTDAQSQLKSARAQVTDLQTQVNDDAAGSAALLDQTKAQVGDLQAQVKKTQDSVDQLQSWFQANRHMPVTTSFEKVDGGRSFTLHVKNLYSRSLTVAIAVTGAVNTRSQDNSIDGGATLDVPKLTAGENVIISSSGFDPVTLSVQ
jgi:hypothetical protein